MDTFKDLKTFPIWAESVKLLIVKGIGLGMLALCRVREGVTPVQEPCTLRVPLPLQTKTSNYVSGRQLRIQCLGLKTGSLYKA